MVARIAPEPIAVSIHTLTDFRSRQVTGERSLLQDSTPTAPGTSAAGERFPEPDQQSQPDSEPPPTPPQSGAMFAAAVIAGALSPTPETLEEVYARIGTAWIPPESELKLRDMFV